MKLPKNWSQKEFTEEEMDDFHIFKDTQGQKFLFLFLKKQKLSTVEAWVMLKTK